MQERGTANQQERRAMNWLSEKKGRMNKQE